MLAKQIAEAYTCGSYLTKLIWLISSGESQRALDLAELADIYQRQNLHDFFPLSVQFHISQPVPSDTRLACLSSHARLSQLVKEHF